MMSNKPGRGNAVSRNQNGWRTVKLGEVCELVGETVNPQQAKSEIFAHYSIPAFDDGQRCVFEPGENILSNKTAFPNGAILFSKLNPRIPRVWNVNDSHDKRRICSTEFLPLKPRLSELRSEFLVFALQEPQTISALRGGVQAATKSRERLKPELVLKAELNLPPVVEQRRIAARLREQMLEVERARAAVQAQLDAAEKLPVALLRNVFASPAARRWPVVLAGDVAEVVGGMQKTPARAPRQFHKQFLTVRNVQRGYMDLSNVERFEVTPKEFERLRLKPGDLLIVEGNGSVDHIGRNALFNEDGEWIHQNHIIRVRLPDENFVPEFVSHYLNSDSGRAQMLEKAKTTTGLYTLSTKKVAALSFPAPPKPEQRIIAAHLESELSTARSLLESLSTRLTETERLPEALLREAFNARS